MRRPSSRGCTSACSSGAAMRRPCSARGHGQGAEMRRPSWSSCGSTCRACGPSSPSSRPCYGRRCRRATRGPCGCPCGERRTCASSRGGASPSRSSSIPSCDGPVPCGGRRTCASSGGASRRPLGSRAPSCCASRRPSWSRGRACSSSGGASRRPSWSRGRACSSGDASWKRSSSHRSELRSEPARLSEPATLASWRQSASRDDGSTSSWLPCWFPHELRLRGYLCRTEPSV